MSSKTVKDLEEGSIPQRNNVLIPLQLHHIYLHGTIKKGFGRCFRDRDGQLS